MNNSCLRNTHKSDKFHICFWKLIWCTTLFIFQLRVSRTRLVGWVTKSASKLHFFTALLGGTFLLAQGGWDRENCSDWILGRSDYHLTTASKHTLKGAQVQQTLYPVHSCDHSSAMSGFGRLQKAQVGQVDCSEQNLDVVLCNLNCTRGATENYQLWKLKVFFFNISHL